MKFNMEIKHEPTGLNSKLVLTAKGPREIIERIEAAVHTALSTSKPPMISPAGAVLLRGLTTTPGDPAEGLIR